MPDELNVGATSSLPERLAILTLGQVIELRI
jgi:hypothetical protein